MSELPPPVPRPRSPLRVLVWIAAAVLLVVAAGWTLLRIDGCGRDGSYGTFGAPGVDATVEVTSEQRISDALGGEEYVYAQRVRGGETSARLDIDINGRFGNTLRVDVSRDGRWARISRTTPVGTVPFAYVDFDAGVVIRWAFATSTDEERRTLLRSNPGTLPDVQEIRGQRVEWVPATKR